MFSMQERAVFTFSAWLFLTDTFPTDICGNFSKDVSHKKHIFYTMIIAMPGNS